MNFFESLTSGKTVLWCAATLSLIIIYPNIGDFFWKLFSPPGSFHRMFEVTPAATVYFVYRYIFFVALTWLMITFNIRRADKNLHSRIWSTFCIGLTAYLVYVVIGKQIGYTVRLEAFTKEVLFQFIIAWLISVMIGHIYSLVIVRQRVEKEMERLRTENLQSRVDALTNQINPHFFFNSLNGVTALVSANRNQETIEYVTKLSNIFRYILQSEKKGLVKLEEELKFLNAYRFLLEIRYSGKLTFCIRVAEEFMEFNLPVLSFLPLIENVVKHNIIDRDHKMMVDISISEDQELVLTNPKFPKFQVEASHGIGLTNLSSRYKLLMGKDIRVIENETIFQVILPLNRSEDESIDS